MGDFFKMRSSVGLMLSVCVHLGFVWFLTSIPRHEKSHFEIVDMSITKIDKPRKEEPAPIEEIEPEVEEPVKEDKIEKKDKPKQKELDEPEPSSLPVAPKEQIEEVQPEVKPEAPPVFDLGDNTFAATGTGAGWSMERSEGNTRFAGVADKKAPSARGTKPKFSEAAKASSVKSSGSEYAPVLPSDLARRPSPVGGAVSAPYPSEAKKAGIEGPVVLRVLIDKTGRVRKTQVIKAPSDILADAATLAMADQRWTPPLDKQGKPVDTVIVYTFRFVLDG